MAAANSVWGIDVGQVALKALKLRNGGEQVEVEAFDIIEHPKVLTRDDADRDQLIRNALEQFLDRNNVQGSDVYVSVPGQSTFSRFVKLPPVEPKQIPSIVRFEAEQQIPFPMDEVIWRWQTFEDPDSPDVEVGIFAMKRQDVAEALRPFQEVELEVHGVQVAPLALYNFMVYDEQLAADGATLLVEVGAEKTDLVVADGSRIWTRTVQIGGSNFTDALVKSFKLSFPKAEKLKRAAASSKHARQIFQAMRPVFSDLVQEIQRSIGFYTSLHRDSRFKKVIGLGNGFRLPGLQKYMEQNLNLPVTRIDSFNQVSPSSQVSAPVFTENVLSFAGAYGLAVQGLGAAAVSTNLLPHDVASHRVWAAKRPWFVAAAAMILVGLLLKGFNSYAAQSQLNADRAESRLASIRSTYDRLNRLKSRYSRLEGDIDGGKDQIRDSLEMFAYRNFWPQLQKLLGESVSAPLRDQTLYQQIARADRWESAEEKYRQLQAIPRAQRELAVIDSMGAQYVPDVARVGRERLQKLVDEKIGLQASRSDSSSSRTTPETDQRSDGEATRGFIVWVVGRTPLPQGQVLGKLRVPVYNRSRTLAQQPRYASLEVVGYESASREGYTPPGGERRDSGPRRGPVYRGSMPVMPPEEMDPFDDMPRGRLPDEEAGPAIPDPMFPGESMAEDTTFGMVWLVTIRDDGVNIPGEESSENTNGRR